MTTLHLRCPSCGKEASVQVVQAIGFDNSLRWSESTVCRKCGYVTEADDKGFPPNQYRESILEDEGVWSIRIENQAARVTSAKVFRELFSLSPKDAMQISKRIPGVVWSGTECEVEWLRAALAENGVESIKERCVENSCQSLYRPNE